MKSVAYIFLSGICNVDWIDPPSSGVAWYDSTETSWGRNASWFWYSPLWKSHNRGIRVCCAYRKPMCFYQNCSWPTEKRSSQIFSRHSAISKFHKSYSSISFWYAILLTIIGKRLQRGNSTSRCFNSRWSGTKTPISREASRTHGRFHLMNCQQDVWS